jgi:hypothetical protein
MKKVCILAMVLCLVLAVSVWAADIPGQKLTDAEASSIRGAAFIFPADLLSTSVVTVFVNNQTPQSFLLIDGGTLIFTGATVTASGIFTK